MSALMFDDIYKDVTAGDVHVEGSLGGEDDDKKGIKREGMVSPKPKVVATSKLAAERSLKPIDEKCSASPFPYDEAALGKLRPDQVPRFFGCLTNPELCPVQTVNLADLVAMQNRVDTEKCQALRTVEAGDKMPVVAQFAGKQYIADGHHRLTAQWLNGEETAEVRFKDLEPVTNAMKRDTSDWSVAMTVTKTAPTGKELWAWASVIEKDGRPVIDHQGDVIFIDELEKAADRFMIDSRTVGLMHETMGHGAVAQSLVFSKELQAALGIDLGKVGWLVKMVITDPEMQKRVASGEIRELSIGGRAVREDI